jgi:hypothetical protein
MKRRRNANAIVQVGLRLRESLRRKLEAAAKEHQVSFNREITARLQDSLEAKTRQSLADIAADMERNWSRMRKLLEKR